MSFIFDAKETPEEAKRRKVAQALFGQQQQAMPQNLGEGLNMFGQALAMRAMQAKARGPFPTQPAGPNGQMQSPSFATMIRNKFGFGGGGLY